MLLQDKRYKDEAYSGTYLRTAGDPCMIRDCKKHGNRPMSITVSGRVRSLQFCDDHASQEAEDERAYQLGL